MMLINIYGPKGAGKTLFGVIILYAAKQRGKNVYSIMKGVKFARYLRLSQFLAKEFEPNTVILLDEVYGFAESRMSMSDLNVLFSHVLFQSRKLGVDIITTSQLKRSVDVRLRELSDIDVLAFKGDKGFYYTFIYESGDNRTYFLPFKVAEKFYSLYDTNEIIETEYFRKKREKLMDKVRE